jgi:hypothetical protein
MLENKRYNQILFEFKNENMSARHQKDVPFIFSYFLS